MDYREKCGYKFTVYHQWTILCDRLDSPANWGMPIATDYVGPTWTIVLALSTHRVQLCSTISTHHMPLCLAMSTHCAPTTLGPPIVHPPQCWQRMPIEQYFPIRFLLCSFAQEVGGMCYGKNDMASTPRGTVSIWHIGSTWLRSQHESPLLQLCMKGIIILRF